MVFDLKKSFNFFYAVSLLFLILNKLKNTFLFPVKPVHVHVDYYFHFTIIRSVETILFNIFGTLLLFSYEILYRNQTKDISTLGLGWSDLALCCDFRNQTHCCRSGIFLGVQFQKNAFLNNHRDLN